MATHAILSPSAAHRWMNCLASPSLECKMADDTSVYAAEGTLAHAICEAKVLASRDGGLAIDKYRSVNNTLFGWEEEELYSEEMEETSDYYRDVVIKKYSDAQKTTPDAKLLVEQTLDFREWVPEGFGTADALIITDGTMEVIDYKHGKGVEVSAVENPQMMIYALGAYAQFSDMYSIKSICMTIIQPRLDNVSTYELETTELLKWGEYDLKPKAEKAFNAVHGKETVEQNAGAWCKFCKVRSRCKKVANIAVESSSYDPRTLTNKEVGKLLELVPTIEAWCSNIKEYALSELLSGNEIKGFKVVEGRKLRVISNEEQLIKNLVKAGFSEDSIYKPKELMTITGLEKLAGKKKFAEVSEGCVSRAEGKPTLAPESDRRQKMTLSSAEEDFKDLVN